MDFDVPKRGLTLQQVKVLNVKLLSESDIANADDIELQDRLRSTSRITEDLITDMKDIQSETDESIENPLRELLRLDKQLRSIRGSLKVEAAIKAKLEGHIEMEETKLGEIQDDPRYTDKQCEEFRKRIEKLNDELKLRQENIDLLKGDLKNQITSIKETITKVLDSNTSLAEKIRTLFREQGITIASVLTAIWMAIGVLVEALMPGGGEGVVGGNPPPPRMKRV